MLDDATLLDPNISFHIILAQMRCEKTKVDRILMVF